MDHLLITKNLEREQVLSLAKQGVEYQVVPALESNFTYNLNEIVEIFNDFSIWIITSKKAVFAIANVLSKNTKKKDQRVLAVGSSVKREMEKLGYEKILSFDSAAELTTAMESYRNEKFIFFCGNNRRDEIPHYAGEQNIDMKMLQVYETFKSEPVIKKNGFGAAFYFSPLGVESTLANNPHLKDLKAYAIGETTAKALKEKGIDEVVIPENTSVNDMISEYLKDKEV